jgi:hypothetical protein
VVASGASSRESELQESIMARTARRTALALALATLVPALAGAAVERRQFTAAAGYLVIEVLDDDLVHFEASSIGSPPPLTRPLYTSPIVLKKDYGGPSASTNLCWGPQAHADRM